MQIEVAAAPSGTPRPVPALPADARNPDAQPRILIPSELPPRYAMQVIGTCLVPEIADGATLEFSRDDPFKPGDLVAIFFRPEVLLEGQWQVMVKRLVMAPPSWVTFPWKDNPKSEVRPLVVAEQLNPRGRYHIECGHLLGIHKCLGPIDRERVRVPSQIEQRQIAKAKGVKR